jgi:hypothetical protein
MSEERVRSAAMELREGGLVRLVPDSRDFVRLAPDLMLLVKMDPLVRGWSTASDARMLSALLGGNKRDGETSMEMLSRSLKWEPRRLNPAARFLVENGFAQATRAPVGADFAYGHLEKSGKS